MIDMNWTFLRRPKYSLAALVALAAIALGIIRAVCKSDERPAFIASDMVEYAQGRIAICNLRQVDNANEKLNAQAGDLLIYPDAYMKRWLSTALFAYFGDHWAAEYPIMPPGEMRVVKTGADGDAVESKTYKNVGMVFLCKDRSEIPH
jgi:hypothetical protein